MDQEPESKPLACLPNVKNSPPDMSPNGEAEVGYNEGETPQQSTETPSQQASASTSAELSHAKQGEAYDSESKKPSSGLLTRGRRAIVKPRVVVVKDQCFEQAASKDGDSKNAIAISKAPISGLDESSPESSTPVEDATGQHEKATVANELSETGEKAPVLLRRGRRPLIKPIVPKSETNNKKADETSQINAGSDGPTDKVEVFS
ncbi:unnamed protein product [Haemonchus placei]|uniref:Uncharacterized protein n=1 Tax=Haemonchus placei TaxID=6290 RepID=A0A0N4WKT2_HAEPC|nr:unnamed protein product [Haemonchus placei]